MGKPNLAATQSSASQAVVLTRLPKPLHPLEWVSLQTGLSNAQRVALHVLVSAYAHFQRTNGEFYIAESIVSRSLSITFATFRNYVTKLHELGLLTLKYRSPNQHGGKSIWTMNLDVVLHSRQLPLTLTDATDSFDDVQTDTHGSAVATEQIVDSASEVSEDHNLNATSPEAPRMADEETISSTDSEEVNANEDDPEYRRLLSMTVEELLSEMNEVRISVERLERALEFVRNREEPKQSQHIRRKASNERAKVSIRSGLLTAVEDVLRGFELARLSDAEAARVVAMEADWRTRHPGDEIPRGFRLSCCQGGGEGI